MSSGVNQEGRGPVKLCPLRRRSRGERGPVKLCPLRVVVTIENQPRCNAMTRQMLVELAAVWDRLGRCAPEQPVHEKEERHVRSDHPACSYL
jgi:hypothetical protein